MVNLRILSYNVFWKAMTNYKNKYPNSLVNIIKFIKNNQPFDIMAFQEASNIHKNINKITNLKYFYIKYQHTKSPYLNKISNSDLVIIYNHKKLLTPLNIYYGFNYDLNRENKISYSNDRPIIILEFKNIFIITLHLGHLNNKYSKYNIDNTLIYEAKIKDDGFIYSYKKETEQSITKLLLNNFHKDLIILGDFNNEDPKTFLTSNILKYRITNIKPKKTCCGTETLTKSYDHILSTLDGTKYEKINKNIEMSDHLPVIRTLNL